MVKAGDEETDAGSERTCIVTRRKAEPAELLRFVRAPDGQVVPDLRRKLPGRGVWVTPTWEAVAEAVRKKSFGRAFKAEVRVSPDLASEVGGLFERAARESVSLANKAGQIVAGFGKVEEALASGRVIAVIHASDAAPDGVRKVSQLVRRAREARGNIIRVIAPLLSLDLGLALGRSHVIHAALIDGSAAWNCLRRMADLEAYRGSGVPEGAVGND